MIDIIHHMTKVNGVLWCMDGAVRKADTCTFTGWIAHSTKEIKELLIGNTRVPLGRMYRPDVKKVYNYIKSEHVGVQFTITNEQLTDEVTLVLEDGTHAQNIGTLQKWAAYHSGFNPIQKKGILVVDDFYKDPDFVRAFAMNHLTFEGSDYHRGKRSVESFILNGTKERFEALLGRPILNWNHDRYANGRFQYCTSQDPIVYHVDIQTHAAMVYLTPNAPLNSGTATYKSKITGATRFDNPDDDIDLYERTFRGRSLDMNFYDRTTYEMVDNIANVYNRCVLFDAKTLHAATAYFGDDIENARFFQLFFFDVDWT